MSDTNIPGGDIDTSLISVDTAQVQSDKGLVNETNMVFSLPPEIKDGMSVEPQMAGFGAGVAPLRGTIDELKLTEGLAASMGPEAAAKSAARVGNIYAAVQGTMKVIDSTHTGVKINPKTNKPLQELKAPEFIPAGMTIADIPKESRGAATAIPLKGAK